MKMTNNVGDDDDDNDDDDDDDDDYDDEEDEDDDDDEDYNQRRSKSQALSSAERDQISQGANLSWNSSLHPITEKRFAPREI